MFKKGTSCDLLQFQTEIARPRLFAVCRYSVAGYFVNLITHDKLQTNNSANVNAPFHSSTLGSTSKALASLQQYSLSNCKFLGLLFNDAVRS